MSRDKKGRAARRRQIEALLRQREERGESLRTISDRSGIPVGTLSWWQHRLRSESNEGADEVEFLEVGMLGDSQFEISFGEVTVRVPPQFDPDALASLLRVLSDC